MNKAHPLAIVYSVAVIIIGSLVLLGWSIDSEILKRLHPTLIAMNPVTAVCLILLGVAVALTRQKNKSALVAILGVIVAAVGIFKLIEIAFGIPIGVDQLLFLEKLSSSLNSQVPNRIAPNTAINLVLLGSSLALMTHVNRRAISLVQVFTLLVLVSSLVACVGYIFNIVNLYGVTNYIPMALHTAFSFLLLSFSILSITSSEGVLSVIQLNNKLTTRFKNLSLRSKLLFAFSTLITLLFIFAVFTFSTLSLIQNTQIPARASIRNISSAELEMQLSEKLFLTRDVVDNTNAPFFNEGLSPSIENWYIAYQKYLDNVDELAIHEKNLGITEEASQIERLRDFATEYNRLFTELVALYKERGFEDFGKEGEMRAAIRELESKTTSDEITVLLLQLRRHEKDFFIRNELESVTLFNDTIKKTRLLLANNPQNLALLETYNKTFQELVELEKRIGLNPESGIQGEIFTEIVRIEPVFSSYEEQVFGLTNAAIDRTKNLTIVLTALFVFTGIWFSLFIVKLITKPLSEVEEAALEVAKGNFDKQLILDANDEVGRLSLAFNEMSSKLKDLYTTLSKEKAKDEAILSGIGDGVFAIDTNNKIILYNESAAKITGFSEKEVMGKIYNKVLQFTHEKEKTIEDVFIKKAQAGEKAEMSKHTMITHKKGHLVPVADSAAPIMDEKGKVDGVVVVFRDATREREINRLKDEFVTVASHELRTPMTAVKGFISMILEGDYGEVNEKLKQPLTDVAASTERLIQLVNDMLNVSRIEAGRLKFNLSEFQINTPIEQMVASLQPIAKDRKITLRAPSIPKSMVQADIEKVTQILNNLVGNALKFIDTGSITISGKEVKDLVIIEVTDTGLGISEPDQKRLFGKFQQISSAQLGKPAGTGLGLYISKQLAQKMGGDLTLVQSEVGKGSTFSFSVPKASSPLAKKTKDFIVKEGEATPDQK